MNLKKRIRNGETVTGCWLNLGSSVTAEIVGKAGFDWVLIDIEHGAGGEQDLLHQLQSLHHTQSSSIVRVESHKRQRIQRALDFGAEGIMCPQIRNIQQATTAVNALRYPPLGSRGVAKMVRATGFGTDFDEYRQKNTENITGMIQVETTEILNSLDEIAELEAVDVLFIGPSDLSMALGVFGEYDHPTFTNAVKATALAAKRAGKAAGILLSTPKDFKKYYQMGIRVIACGADGAFVNEGARKMSDALRDEKNHSETTR